MDRCEFDTACRGVRTKRKLNKWKLSIKKKKSKELKPGETLTCDSGIRLFLGFSYLPIIRSLPRQPLLGTFRENIHSMWGDWMNEKRLYSQARQTGTVSVPRSLLPVTATPWKVVRIKWVQNCQEPVGTVEFINTLPHKRTHRFTKDLGQTIRIWISPIIK